jgi:anti-sigma B factor antagonist
MNFSIRTEQVDDVPIIALTGEVDLYTAPEFKEELISVIDAGPPGLVVDLSGTTFIDSTTLGVLVSGLKRLRPDGRQLALVVPDRNIRKIFDITGLDRVFPIHESRREALAEIEIPERA